MNNMILSFVAAISSLWSYEKVLYPKSEFEVVKNYTGDDGVWTIFRRKKDDWLFLEPKEENGGHEFSMIFIHGLTQTSWWSLSEFLPYN